MLVSKPGASGRNGDRVRKDIGPFPSPMPTAQPPPPEVPCGLFEPRGKGVEPSKHGGQRGGGSWGNGRLPGGLQPFKG